MPRWLNPRVLALIATAMVLIHVSKTVTRQDAMRDVLLACGGLLVLFALVFVLPIWPFLTTVKRVSTLATLIGGWIAVALALIADATPLTPEEGMEHPPNWPRNLFAMAAGLAFILFAETAFRGFRLRDDQLAIDRDLRRRRLGGRT